MVIAATSASSWADRSAKARALFCSAAGAMLLGACGAAPSDANVAEPAAGPVETAAAPAVAPSSTGSDELGLSGAPSAAATATVLGEAKRQGLTGVEIAPAQSFRITHGGREVATLVTGEGTMPGSVNAGCFVAIVRNGDAALIPTIGYADYEAQTCGGPVSVGLLSQGNPVRFGMVFDASSPNAQGREPVIVSWDRGTNTLLIDDDLSAKASQAGALTIAAMRKVT